MRPYLVVIGLVLAACQGGRSTVTDTTAQRAGGTDTASAGNGATAFTAIRPIPSAESLAALAGGRPARSVPSVGSYSIHLAYDGARAQVVITSPDGQIIRDTTRPRDTSCDDFAPDTSSDPNADGVGCESEEYGATVINSSPGIGYIQFTAADTGLISFSVEPLSGGNYSLGWWGVRGFHVRPGQTHILQLSLPGRREEGRVQVVSLTGPLDSLVAPR